MKTFTKLSIVAVLTVCAILGLTGPTMAASTPSLGAAASFGILSSTYTNTAAGTINGDLGYTTPPATPPTVNGTIYVPKPSQAGTDQGLALVALDAEPCDFTFATGAIDLATDITHGPVGIYTPRVYCIIGAVDIGGGGTIILSGAGTYLFRASGAFNTSASSVVVVASGASECDVFWTPVATTLGANSTFLGTVIDNAAITVGNNVTWLGRALNFATTVTTNNDTITVPTCSAPATFRVIKQVVNDNGGSASAGLFSLHVKRFGTDIVGSPALGAVTPGTSYSLNAGTYAISEDTNSSYAQSFTGDCDANGNITLASSDDKSCTIINNDIAPPSGGGGSLAKDVCIDGDYSSSYYDGICGIVPAVLTGTVITTGTTVITGEIVTTGDVPLVPGLPKTGIFSGEKNKLGIIAIIAGILVISIGLTVAIRRRRV